MFLWKMLMIFMTIYFLRSFALRVLGSFGKWYDYCILQHEWQWTWSSVSNCKWTSLKRPKWWLASFSYVPSKELWLCFSRDLPVFNYSWPFTLPWGHSPSNIGCLVSSLLGFCVQWAIFVSEILCHNKCIGWIQLVIKRPCFLHLYVKCSLNDYVV